MHRSMAPTPDPAPAATIDDHDALPAGTRLAEFEILPVVTGKETYEGLLAGGL